MVIKEPQGERDQAQQKREGGQPSPTHAQCFGPSHLALQNGTQQLPTQQRQRRNNGSFLGERRKSQEHDGSCRSSLHVHRQSPKRQRTYHHVEVRQRALRKENGVDRGAQDGCSSHLFVGHVAREPPQPQQGKRSDQQHRSSRHRRGQRR